MADEGVPTRSIADRPGDHAVLPSFRLEVIEGADRGLSFVPTGARTVIGTHRSADVVLSDPTVSRFHCELTLGERGVRVRDLDSTNATLVDGIELAAGVLRRPATLALGDTRIRVAPGDETVRVPLFADERFGPLVGRSRAIRAVFALLERAAAAEATVLLEGETGTGKDLAASAIHGAGARQGGPFVVVDCGAVPRDLIESELFGHVRGSFTGAHGDRVGAFEAAHGGTLFLDEIGELPLELQPVLLRALEAREVRRVGSNRAVPIDVRVIAATNRSLTGEVNAKRFRSDLYYRLAVLVIPMPPLRERSEDVPLLVERLLEAIGMTDHPRAQAIRDEVQRGELARHPWPGNVRELRNLVERGLAFGELAPLEMPAGPHPDVDVTQPYRVARQHWLARFERVYLEGLLAQHGDNVTLAARAAGVDRGHLHRLLSRAKLR